MKLHILCGLMACLSATSCQSDPAVALEPSSPPTYASSEVKWSRGHGPNIFDGVAAFRGRHVTKTCAGEEVYLRPRSVFEDYRNRVIFGNLDWAKISVEKYLAAGASGSPRLQTPPAAYDADARKARCSIDGKFLFAGIPDGEYYALVMIIPRAYLGKVTPMEDIEVVMRRITVIGGGIQSIDLFSAK